MQMNIFGGFSLSDGQVSVNESTLHSNKLNRLLIYILLHRDRDLSHQELIDMVTSPAGTTFEGLQALHRCGFEKALTECFDDTVRRAYELGK